MCRASWPAAPRHRVSGRSPCFCLCPAPDTGCFCSLQITVLKAVDHFNIIQYHAHFMNGNDLNIVMDYAAGGDLSDKIRNRTECVEELLLPVSLLSFPLTLFLSLTLLSLFAIGYVTAAATFLAP